jgi:mxaA protein
MATAAASRQLRLIGVASAVLGLWLIVAVLLRRWKPGAQRPVAAACADLRRLRKAAGSLDGARAAIQRVHRAFDQAAGHRLFADGVDAFCRRVGADEDLHRRSVDFYALSRALFFRTGISDVPAGLGQELADLCQAWRSFEKRHS